MTGVTVVDIVTNPGFSVGNPRLLFEGNYSQVGGGFPGWAASPDGQRFLMMRDTTSAAVAAPLHSSS